jgi:glutamyl/glutaminyl-tRNA synthetase
VARRTGGRVVFRVEDHDRQRCRPEFEAALLDDLDALGFEPDEPTIDSFRGGVPSEYRQSDNDPAYLAAVGALDAQGLVYACDCTRSTFADWASAHGQAWSGSGCPGGCAARSLDRGGEGSTWRVALGEGPETWTDLVLGLQAGEPSARGDLPIRDRHGNWTYALCVVVDDVRHGIDLVIRGEDLLDATPAQICLGRLLGRDAPPSFLHHPLIRRPDGRKLSKAQGATGVRALLAAGERPEALRARAAESIGLPLEGRTPPNQV